MPNVTGRDGFIIAEALAFAYAAMKQLPLLFKPKSDMADMREILFARLGDQAEWRLGAAMLLAWNLRADVPPTAGITAETFTENLRRVRDQVLAEPPGDPDIAILVRHIDELLEARKG